MGSALAIADDRTEWLLWRRGGIGGSDAAAICGESPFQSPLDVWLDKRGLLPLQRFDADDEPMYWGHQLEPLVIKRFERDTDMFVVEEQTRLEKPGRRWMRATLDGFVSDAPTVVPADVFNGWTPLGIFEAKTSSARAWDWAEGPPMHVQIQVQHNLAVSELAQAWVAVLLTAPSLRFRVFEIPRDEAAISALMDLEENFWRRVENDDPPDAGSSDVDLLRHAYADVDVTGTTAVLPPIARDLVEGLKAARGAVKVAEEQVAYHEAQLMQLLRERQVGLLDGEPVITWKGHSRSHLDVEGLKAAHPALVRSFTSDRPYRQMRLVEARKQKGELR